MKTWSIWQPEYNQIGSTCTAVVLYDAYRGWIFFVLLDFCAKLQVRKPQISIYGDWYA